MSSMVGVGDVPFGVAQGAVAEQAYRRAKRAFQAGPPADGLVLLGGGTPLQSIIGVLETDLGKPVIANNQANLWNAPHDGQRPRADPGLGVLMTCF